MLKGWAVNDPKYKEANITIIKSCKEDDPCFLFNMLGPQGADIGDTWAGVILLLISLVMLCSCLMGMVKLLNSLLGEKVREAIKEGVNKDIPIKGLAWLTGYLAPSPPSSSLSFLSTCFRGESQSSFLPNFKPGNSYQNPSGPWSLLIAW